MAGPPADIALAQSRAVDFVKDLLSRYASYHDQKESMAYAGFTVFAGTIAAILVSGSWPPWWGYNTKWYALAALTGTWFAVLGYLRFQLRRRRLAALRVAGCEHLLAKWVLHPPSVAHLDLGDRQLPPLRLSKVEWLWDHIFPLRRAVPVLKKATAGHDPTYPAALITAWLAMEKSGTDAIIHERLIVFAGWVLYAVGMAYTIARFAV